MYGRNAISEVQPDEIVYTTDYQKQVSITLTIYVLLDQYIHVTHSIPPFRLEEESVEG